MKSELYGLYIGTSNTAFFPPAGPNILMSNGIIRTNSILPCFSFHFIYYKLKSQFGSPYFYIVHTHNKEIIFC